MKITDEMVEAATKAIHDLDCDDEVCTGKWELSIEGRYGRWARSAVEAAAPLIAAQALRSYADEQHPSYEGLARWTDYGTGEEYDAVCVGCSASWSLDEGGCTERVELIRAANALVTPAACTCHETGAPCNCADEVACRNAPNMVWEHSRAGKDHFRCVACGGGMTKARAT